MNDDHDNAQTDREMLKRYPGIGLTDQEADGLDFARDPDAAPWFNEQFTKAEERVRRVALRGWSQCRLDFGQIQEIRAFLTGNSNECPPEYREKYRATRERFGRNGKQVYVYRLDITYPEGSREPGWKPALWQDKEFVKTLPLKVRAMMVLRPARFKWPRERMYMSSDAAWARAFFLKSCGASVTILRSQPVTWTDAPLEEFAGIQSNW